jgi:Sulfotransferase family
MCRPLRVRSLPTTTTTAPTLTMPQTRESPLRYTAGRLRRHLRWARTQGLGRLLEEDDLNPLARASRRVAKWRWRRAHGVAPGTATAVLLVGLQRSGTNMVVRGLERAPEFEVYNENHPAAFDRFRLRPDGDVRALVQASLHPYVLLKPLCDAHRTVELLEALQTRSAPRALWVYRSVEGRARSAVAKFGDHNLQVLRELAAGHGRDRWQAQGLSRDSLELIGRFDWSAVDALSAAALFWYVRNRLYFELGLHDRRDVLLVSYDAMVADPAAEMRRICAFLGFPYHPWLVNGIHARPPATAPPTGIHPHIAARCAGLTDRLEAARRAHTTTPDPRTGV